MSLDRGITSLIPRYEKPLLTKADTAYWEALYHDGTVSCEADGGAYPRIDRGNLSSFRIIQGGEIVFETYPPLGLSGRNLVYRRVSTLGGARSVFFIVGWMPEGPLFGVDIDHGQYYEDTERLLRMVKPDPAFGDPPDLFSKVR